MLKAHAGTDFQPIIEVMYQLITRSDTMLFLFLTLLRTDRLNVSLFLLSNRKWWFIEFISHLKTSFDLKLKVSNISVYKYQSNSILINLVCFPLVTHFLSIFIRFFFEISLKSIVHKVIQFNEFIDKNSLNILI